MRISPNRTGTPIRPARRSSFRPPVELLESRQLMSATPVFTTTNLVSDGAASAVHVDGDLVNPWGVSFAPGGAFWISDNGTGKATLYDGAGVKAGLVVAIPNAAGSSGSPTGQVFNGAGGFNVTSGGKTGSSVFIFAGEDGTITGWSPSVDSANAIIAVNKNPGAVYKGLAMGTAHGAPELFAANFRAGTVDAFDSNFKPVQEAKGAFTDPSIPKGFAPFNVQNIGGDLFVTFAYQKPDKHDDQAGAFHGFVDVFDTSGHLVRRFQHGAYDNSPWGLAVAPPSFGKYAGDLLVGNFGSGWIDVFNMTNGKFIDYLRDANGTPIHENGLWAITLGTGSSTASTNTLYFTAGINDESDGLFGTIEAAISTGAAKAKTAAVGQLKLQK